MKVPRSVLRVVILGPALLASGVSLLVVLALLPPDVSLLALLLGAGWLAALAAGAGEGPLVEVLTRSRRATAAELEVLDQVVARVAGLDIDAAWEVRRVYVRRAPRAAMPAALRVGRRSVVVTPWVVEAVYTGAVTVEEATAVLAHALGSHRAARPRCELAVLAFTFPWRAIRALARGIGAGFASISLVRSAWLLRGLVGVVCVVQSVVEGRAAIGVLAGVVIALSYAVPAAERAWATRVWVAGDQFVVQAGLGWALAGLLRRQRYPVTIERLQRLDAPAPESRVLRLVRN